MRFAVLMVLALGAIASCSDPPQSLDAHDAAQVASGFGCGQAIRREVVKTPEAEAEAACTVHGQPMVVDVWTTRANAANALRSTSVGCAVAADMHAHKVWIVSHVNWAATTSSQHEAEVLHETWRSSLKSNDC